MNGRGRMGGKSAYFGKVDSLERELAQTFTPVNIGLGGTRHATTAKFRSHTILLFMCE